jgi:hypothetical protein
VDSTPLLPPLGLSLLSDRIAVRAVQDPHEGRRIERVELPPLTDDETAALEMTRDALQVYLQPGRRAAIVAMLARLANLHRTKDRSPQEWQMLFEDYCEDLGEFSEAHVSEAIKEHRQNSNWFPTIAELRGRCLELRARDKFRLERAKRLLGVAA